MKTAVLLSALFLCTATFAAVTPEDKASLSNALVTVQRVCLKAQDEIYDELKARAPSLKLRKAHGMSRLSSNDYRNFIWIVVTCGERRYWLCMMHENLDLKTGNPHTQYGRINFWRDVHVNDPRYEATPHVKHEGEWRFSWESAWKKMPVLYIWDDAYSPEYVVDLFLEFLRESGEVLE